MNWLKEGTKSELIKHIHSVESLEELKKSLGPTEEQQQAYRELIEEMAQHIQNAIGFYGPELDSLAEHNVAQLSAYFEEIKAFKDQFEL